MRDVLCEMGCEDSIIFENPSYDEAIIGVSTDGQVIYDYELMVDQLAREDGIDEVDAMEFIDYNTIRAIPYFPEPKPIVMYRILEVN